MRYNLFTYCHTSKVRHRDWLLPMLMNGQVRVGDVEEDGVVGMAAETFGEYKVKGE